MLLKNFSKINLLLHTYEYYFKYIFTYRSSIDVNKKKNSPLRENKRQNSDDFIPLNVNNEESNPKKNKYTNKNKK